MGVERIINLLALAANTRIPDQVRDLLTKDADKPASTNPTGVEQPIPVTPPAQKPLSHEEQLQGAALRTGTVGTEYARTDGVLPTLLEGERIADDPNSNLPPKDIDTLNRARQVPEYVITSATRVIAGRAITDAIPPVVTELLQKLNLDEDQRRRFLAAARTAEIFIPTIQQFGL